MNAVANELIFSIPSKTFIVGEYLALKGGPSLVIASGPNFKISLKKGKRDNIPLHPESCAGQYFISEGMPVEDFIVDDPHDGLGGFGRSSAEFLSLYLANTLKGPGHLSEVKIKELVKSYQSCAAALTPPSGADLVAQLKGGICLYDGNSFESQSFNWPWPGKTFLIFHTGKKVATHDHLKSLEDFPVKGLRTVAKKTIHCFLTKDYNGFIQCVNAYSDQLLSMGFVVEEILDRVQHLRQLQGVDAVKGCGALGVDTVLVICDRSEENLIIEQAEQLELDFICRLSDLTQGTRVKLAEVEGA